MVVDYDRNNLRDYPAKRVQLPTIPKLVSPHREHCNGVICIVMQKEAGSTLDFWKSKKIDLSNELRNLGMEESSPDVNKLLFDKLQLWIHSQ